MWNDNVNRRCEIQAQAVVNRGGVDYPVKILSFETGNQVWVKTINREKIFGEINERTGIGFKADSAVIKMSEVVVFHNSIIQEKL